MHRHADSVKLMAARTQETGNAADWRSQEGRGFYLEFLEQRIPAETGDEPDLVAAAEQCLRDLGGCLVGLVGAEGYQALLQSALHLAAAEFPPLAAVEARARPSGRVVRLRMSVRRLPPTEVKEALALIVADLVHLLTRLVGRDMTLHMLHDLWPRISDASTR